MDIIPNIAHRNDKKGRDFYKLGRITANLEKKKEELEQATVLSVLQKTMLMDTANKLKDLLAEVQRQQKGLDMAALDAQIAGVGGPAMGGQLPMGGMEAAMAGGGAPPQNMGQGGMPPEMGMPPGGMPPEMGGGNPMAEYGGGGMPF